MRRYLLLCDYILFPKLKANIKWGFYDEIPAIQASVNGGAEEHSYKWHQKIYAFAGCPFKINCNFQ